MRFLYTELYISILLSKLFDLIIYLIELNNFNLLVILNKVQDLATNHIYIILFDIF